MIYIKSGKLSIPENERYLGCAGDNYNTQKQFMVEDIADQDCIYRLYLKFDDGTVNYFVLDSKVENGSTILIWDILEEHILKSGIVSAQIKSIATSGEAYHTTWDYFFVGNSGDFSDALSTQENAEFLRYEKVLNELYSKINEIDLEAFVEESRTIAGIELSADITAEELQAAMKTYPFKIFISAPTKTTVGKVGQLGGIISYSPISQEYTVTLYLCCGINSENNTYNWATLNGYSVTDDQISTAIAEYLLENPIECTATDGKSAYELAVSNGFEGTEAEWLESLNGADGQNGEDGSDGTSVTISSVTESTEDGGNNTVIFTDGTSLTVKNGSKGSQGDTGAQGEQGIQGERGEDGYTPVKGTDYFTEEDKKTLSPLYGKKIVYDGDSICLGAYGNGGYANIIANNTNSTYDNQSQGGARLTTATDDATYHSVVDNLVNLPTDGDLYCFEGGINDYWTPKELGTFSKTDFTGELDTNTICGALETIFRYALTTFAGKPICFIITHKVQSTAYKENDNGDTFEDFHNAMVEICEKYSIPYYDAFSRSGLNGWNTTQSSYYLTGNSNATPDGCHPNAEGYKRYYVPQLISLFESILPIDAQETTQTVLYTNTLDEAGYTEGYRLSTSSGTLKENENTDVSGFIPCVANDIIYLKNITAPYSDSSNYYGVVCYYDSDKNFITGFYVNTIDSTTQDDDGNISSFVAQNLESVAYLRFCANNIDDTSIITVNEPIE